MQMNLAVKRNNINIAIDNLISESTNKLEYINESSLLGILITFIGKLQFLKFLKLAKGSGVIVIDPSVQVKDEFVEKIRSVFIISIKSIAISTVLNQIIGMLFNSADQSTLNKVHIKVATELFTTSVLLVLIADVISKIKKDNLGKELTRNELGIIATTVLGMTLFTFMQLSEHHILDFGLQPTTVTAIGVSLFLTFIVNTTYINSVVQNVFQRFSNRTK